jgi:hypothetical protein
MARGDKNLLTYDDLCNIYLFHQLLSIGFNRLQVAFVIRKIAKKGLTISLNSELRYVAWNTKFSKEGGAVEILNKIPNSMLYTSALMLVIDLLEVKRAVDRKRKKRGG